LTDPAKAAHLTWRYRIVIAAGVAVGLNYLHRAEALPALHMDIKAANVVLAADYEPKIIDCGA
jgi:serine/threonine protein kinase